MDGPQRRPLIHPAFGTWTGRARAAAARTTQPCPPCAGRPRSAPGGLPPPGSPRPRAGSWLPRWRLRAVGPATQARCPSPVSPRRRRMPTRSKFPADGTGLEVGRIRQLVALDGGHVLGERQHGVAVLVEPRQHAAHDHAINRVDVHVHAVAAVERRELPPVQLHVVVEVVQPEEGRQGVLVHAVRLAHVPAATRGPTPWSRAKRSSAQAQSAVPHACSSNAEGRRTSRCSSRPSAGRHGPRAARGGGCRRRRPTARPAAPARRPWRPPTRPALMRPFPARWSAGGRPSRARGVMRRL